ncbi:PQQ-dependent dehydrogenase, methanol/ethanol family [Alteraurantiacibacter aquimixticola]|uniref:PQQ-dependent dehydrogenase, methanol/ethanol family n=1 Tax=Alteraurantiacibacter aquimixticola TaxID=2489173 RepID=A0A4T3EZX4_9SPHN|nr:PQQ-dependent dehydrogenase, methanol/ethanol family [Alteraurantiacibacter aquimixticola]TIX49482.1 PQQ-dependent dehydrogenase, methanol/ethanol family [Alteraurantiacibacter aquimixticola]
MIRKLGVVLAGALLAGGIGLAYAQDSSPANVDWAHTGLEANEQRFSPLDQINAENVSELGLAWYVDLDTDRGQEATPIVVDGVLFNIEPWNITTAYNAATGEQLWRFDPQVPLRFGRLACCDIVTRGLAYHEGKVLIATLDGRLIALDAQTGEEVWSTLTVDNAMNYTITGAPRVHGDMVFIGNGGAEMGVRGYVSAYDTSTGEMIWRWHTVPGNPADGFENAAMEAAAETWSGEWWQSGGGGTVWDSLTVDPELGLLYIGTGNGSPWVRKWRSPEGGDNLYLASIVALDIATGEYRWHYQTVPGEEWDYTATQNMILADMEIDGRMRQVIMQAPKNGFFYVLDRETGELISAETIAPISWATGIDMETGRPIENPEARYGEIPVMVSPGAGGAHNWNPMAYSPETGLAYVPVTETYMAYAAAPDYTPGQGLGTAFAGHDEIRREIAEYADEHSKGWLSAWDPVTQTERWRVPYAKKGSGGVLVTAGNLVFQGTIGTSFAAYDATTGEKVWEMPVQNVPIAAPITYMVDGVQYIAVNAGWGGGLAHVERASFSELHLGKPRLLVFRLGGTVELPAMPEEGFVVPAMAARPPALEAGPEVVAQGERLFGANCSICHGNAARGGVKDLRHMSAETHATFADIVLGGSRAANGMASFADVLSSEESEAIHHYLIARANEDWGS